MIARRSVRPACPGCHLRLMRKPNVSAIARSIATSPRPARQQQRSIDIEQNHVSRDGGRIAGLAALSVGSLLSGDGTRPRPSAPPLRPFSAHRLS